MSELTSLAPQPILVEHESPSFQITGGLRRSLSAVSLDGPGFGLNVAKPVTVGAGNLDEPLTSAAPPDSLTTAIEAVRLGELTPPSALQALLTKAVASNRARENEDVESWAARVAHDAAVIDA